MDEDGPWPLASPTLGLPGKMAGGKQHVVKTESLRDKFLIDCFFDV